MEDMDESDHNTQSSPPAVIFPQPVMDPRRAEQQPARWHSGRLPDRLRRASRHPAVAGSLATVAGLILEACLKRAFTPPTGSAGPAGSTVTPAHPAVPDGGFEVLFRRTVVVETWTVRGERS
jgi:hypothetical protein